MANDTYWGTVPSALDVNEPGDHEDNYGTTNDKPAIWMGECLVEGSPEEWAAFAVMLLAKFDAGTPRALAADYRAAAEGDSADDEAAAASAMADYLESIALPAESGDPDDFPEWAGSMIRLESYRHQSELIRRHELGAWANTGEIVVIDRHLTADGLAATVGGNRWTRVPATTTTTTTTEGA